MDYVLLREWDNLPAVGVLQKLLNRTGARLAVDGIYGPRTKAAVQQFQKARHLAVDGVVGVQTWPRVSAGANLPIVSSVDVFAGSYNADAIQRVGGNPIVLGGMSNGVEQAVRDIVARSHAVFLLRFHGHGAQGVAGISFGRGELDPHRTERADVELSNLHEIRHVLARLRPIFGRYGCVQFMHCETGGGPQGRTLLREIANLLGVPVSAGIHTQYGGGTWTFKFEGPTFTAFPAGASLRDWCRKLPEFPPFSPA